MENWREIKSVIARYYFMKLDIAYWLYFFENLKYKNIYACLNFQMIYILGLKCNFIVYKNVMKAVVSVDG